LQNRSYLFLLLVLALGGLSGWLFEAKAPHYGLDVSGGIRLVYQLDMSQIKDPNADKGAIADKIVSILEVRIAGMGGASEGTVQKKGDDQVIVEIPGTTDIAEARKIIGSSAKMSLYHAKTLVTEKVTGRMYEDREPEDPNNPIVYFSKKGSSTVIKPGDPEYAEIIKSWGPPILEGVDLQEAGSKPAGDSYEPTMRFSRSGADKIRAWCDHFYNTREKLAYVLDGKVLNVAGLADGARISDEAFIQGKFTPQYVTSLASLLNGGSLPVDLKELSFQNVDPTIGKQALGQFAPPSGIVGAGAIAFLVVVVFLIAYYAFPGLVAAIALGLYVLFTLSVLKAIGATFSLAAIAGFILSVGMAVDANILVFERFKEEMKRGRTLHSAIELGFKRALPAIIDSNACTILTSLVLSSLGTGQVKGFATTLIFGVLISLFTAVFVTRSLLMFFVDSGIAVNPKMYAVDRNWFKKLEARADTEPLQVVEKAKKWFLISAATIVVFFFFFGGFKLNVEFRGGYEALYSLSAPPLANTTYAANLEKAGLPGGNVKFATTSPELLTITFKDPSKITGTDKAAVVSTALGVPGVQPMNQSQTSGLTLTYAMDDLGASKVEDVLKKLGSANLGEYTWTSKIDPAFKRNLVYVSVPPNKNIDAISKDSEKCSKFIADKAGLTGVVNRGFTAIGPIVSAETIRNAILAVVFSSGLIIIYLAMRFGFSLGGFLPGLRFGASAILALLHDILVVIGSAALVGTLLGWEISALFITAMLTVIGFSVHDTIVIFDRIRENLRRPEKGHDLGFVMDRSITQSFARSLNTSMTVVVTLAILIMFGTATPDLKFFCVAMLVGIVSGTYSSIYNASPILYLWDKAITKKDPKKGLIGLALEEQAKARVMQTQVKTAQAPQVQSDQTGRSYGQVRRRASEPKKGHVEIEDEP
jgi:protein-export membrane protein SecD/preprotein translocase SecF subunit